MFDINNINKEAFGNENVDDYPPTAYILFYEKEDNFNCFFYQGLSTNNSNIDYFNFDMSIDSLQNSDNENNDSMIEEDVEKIRANNNDEDNSYKNNLDTLLDKFGELLLEDKLSQRNNIEISNENQRIFEDKNIKKNDA